MNKKQSSVEWLINQVEDFIGLIPVDMIEQAKTMHKEEIKSAYVEGLTTSIDNPFLPPNEYYKETFENE